MNIMVDESVSGTVLNDTEYQEEVKKKQETSDMLSMFVGLADAYFDKYADNSEYGVATGTELGFENNLG